MSKKVKVLIGSLTAEGKHIKANTVEEISQEDYDKLSGLGNVRDYNKDTDVEVEVEDASILEEMVEALEGEKTELASKVEALEVAATESAAEIEALKAFLKEAVTLPKGQVPNGYEA